MGVLTVHLVKAENLPDRDGIGKSDPYVKFELMKDRIMFDKNFGKKESSKKNNDLNPVYNETFEFPDLPSLNNMILKIRIMDHDVGLDDEIGSTQIPLENLRLNETPKDMVQVVGMASPTVLCSPSRLLCFCCRAMLCPKRPPVILLKLSYR